MAVGCDAIKDKNELAERCRELVWLRSLLCVSFSTSTLMVVWQEGQPAYKNSLPLIPTFSSRKGGGVRPKGNQMNSAHREERALNGV